MLALDTHSLNRERVATGSTEPVIGFMRAGDGPDRAATKKSVGADVKAHVKRARFGGAGAGAVDCTANVW